MAVIGKQAARPCATDARDKVGYLGVGFMQGYLSRGRQGAQHFGGFAGGGAHIPWRVGGSYGGQALGQRHDLWRAAGGGGGESRAGDGVHIATLRGGAGACKRATACNPGAYGHIDPGRAFGLPQWPPPPLERPHAHRCHSHRQGPAE